jgi:hypothetical protein
VDIVRVARLAATVLQLRRAAGAHRIFAVMEFMGTFGAQALAVVQYLCLTIRRLQRLDKHNLDRIEVDLAARNVVCWTPRSLIHHPMSCAWPCS